MMKHWKHRIQPERIHSIVPFGSLCKDEYISDMYESDYKLCHLVFCHTCKQEVILND